MPATQLQLPGQPSSRRLQADKHRQSRGDSDRKRERRCFAFKNGQLRLSLLYDSAFKGKKNQIINAGKPLFASNSKICFGSLVLDSGASSVLSLPFKSPPAPLPQEALHSASTFLERIIQRSSSQCYALPVTYVSKGF